MRTLAILALGLILGILGARHYKPVINAARDGLASAGIINPRLSERIAHGRDRLQKNPRISTCPDASRERVAVLLIAGQSNAANRGNPGGMQVVDNEAILNLHEGKCFIARHPLLGATHAAQSPWIETARLLLEAKAYDKVVIIATAIGGTCIRQWVAGGEFHQRFMLRIEEAKSVGLSPTHFLWHQGECEARHPMAGSDYASTLSSIVVSTRAKVGAQIPSVIALATLCQTYRSEEIRSAQANVAKTLKNVATVESDSIGYEFRFDGCHFTKGGLEELARRYSEKILSR